jgi:Lrp/AsnC family transcriptional regulator, regulator for asnA, asnC and gidA
MIDDTAKNIITLLKDDARITNKEIAQKLGISEGTVRNRIKLLLDDGILKLAGLTSPDKDTEKQLVMLGINLSASKDLQEKSEEIANLPGVNSTSITTGRYDLLVEVWVDVKYGLINFLSDSLSKVDGIVSTESFVIMKSYNKWI